MNADLALVFPVLSIFLVSVTATAFSLWLGARLAPWFLSDRSERPTVRSYFLDPAADLETTPARIVASLIAAAILMAMLLAMALAVKVGGVAFS